MFAKTTKNMQFWLTVKSDIKAGHSSSSKWKEISALWAAQAGIPSRSGVSAVPTADGDGATSTAGSKDNGAMCFKMG